MNPSVILFFSSMFGSRLGDQLLLFVVPLVVFQTTGSVSLSGLAFAAETLPRVLFFPVCGVLSDRFSPIVLSRISQAGRAAICLAGLGGAYLFGHVGWIVAISAICGLLTTQGFMAREVMLPQIFENVAFSKVQSFAQTVDQACIVLGPFLAAALFGWFGWEIVVAVSGTLFFLADIFLILWSRKDGHKIKPVRPSQGHWSLPYRRAMTHILHLPGLKRIIALTSLVNLVFGVTLATSASVVTGYLQKSDGLYALLQSAGAVVTFTVLVLTGVSRLGVNRIGLISFSALVLGGLITGLAEQYWVYLAGYCLVLGFDSMFNVYIRTARQKIIPPEDYGKTTGLAILFNNITLPLSGFLVGLVPSVDDTGWLVLGLTAFTALAGLLLALWPSRVRVEVAQRV
ncbi:MFS transporter [Roseibium sp. RKSG952]|uniref:MFS transporter n=1 Tax=Roseibium sp. RKSG952 TaxID=2529384 RepID=UPI0012BC60E2|nr:MFS transporter [Roseibium sp. RKSG952]MTH98833.1 MFS transporter [Roseibium sp. RKSG952]